MLSMANWRSGISIALTLLIMVSSAHIQTNTTYLHYYNVKNAVGLARKLLTAAGTFNTSARLPLLLLYSSNIAHDKDGPCFKCAMGFYHQHLVQNTPTDIYIFVKPEYAQRLAQLSWIYKPNVYIIPLDITDFKSWRLPLWLRPRVRLSYNLEGK